MKHDETDGAIGLKSVFTVIVEEYPRLYKTSEAQRAGHYMYNGKTIKYKQKLIPRKYLLEGRSNENEVCVEDLLPPYYLGSKHKTNKEEGYYLYDTNAEAQEAFKKGAKVILLKFNADSTTVDPVIANADQVGQPNYVHIRGQDIYSGVLNEFVRGEIMNYIKDFFRPAIEKAKQYWELEKLPAKLYPYRLQIILIDSVHNEYDNAKEFPGQRWDLGNRLFPYVKAFPDLLVEMGILEDDDRLRISKIEEVFVPLDKVPHIPTRRLIFKLIPDSRELVSDFVKYINYEKENKLRNKTQPRKSISPRKKGSAVKQVKIKFNK